MTINVEAPPLLSNNNHSICCLTSLLIILPLWCQSRNHSGSIEVVQTFYLSIAKFVTLKAAMWFLALGSISTIRLEGVTSHMGQWVQVKKKHTCSSRPHSIGQQCYRMLCLNNPETVRILTTYLLSVMPCPFLNVAYTCKLVGCHQRQRDSPP